MAVDDKVPLSEHFKLEAWMDVIDDQAVCAICGTTLEIGQEAIEVPMGTLGTYKIIASAHLGCAINSGEVDLDS